MKALIKFFIALNANSRPLEIAIAMAVGFLLVLVPKGFLWVLLLVFFLLWKLHIPSMLLTMVLLNPLGVLLSPSLDRFGYFLLSQDLFASFVQQVMVLPLGSLLRLNNTVVFGGLLAGLLCLIPLSIVFLLVVILYRKTVRDFLMRLKIVQGIAKLPLIKSIVKAYKKAGFMYS